MPRTHLFLITPPELDAEAALAILGSLPRVMPATSLLISAGPNQEVQAQALTRRVQALNIAVLMEDDLELAKREGADGVLLAPDMDAFKRAGAVLPPKSIRGVRAEARHEAMDFADAGADFIAFEEPALLAWWGEVFQVPCVSMVPGQVVVGADFLVPGPGFWTDTESALRAIEALSSPDAAP